MMPLFSIFGRKNRPTKRKVWVISPLVQSKKESVPCPAHRRTEAVMEDMHADLSGHRPSSASRPKFQYLKSGCFSQIPQTLLWVAVKIIRQFMRWPIHRRGKQHFPFWAQYAMELAPDCKRVGNVFEDLGTKHGIKTFIRNRNRMSGTCKINIAPFGVEVASHYSARMGIISSIGLHSATNIEQVALKSVGQPSDAEFNETVIYEGRIGPVAPRCRLMNLAGVN